MKIVPLKRAVEENNIQIVEAQLGEGVSNRFEVGSPDYKEFEMYLVKGEFTVKTEGRDRVLKVSRLEKDISITINPHTVQAEDAPKVETPEDLEAFINLPVTAIVFKRDTLESAGRDIPRKHTAPFADAVLESYRKKNAGVDVRLEDFAVVEIDWANKHVRIKSVEPK